jgi:PPK2 family polyphosphate:nucleotide phosphotransferase
VTSKPTADYRTQFLVEPGSKLQLAAIDPGFKGAHESHEQALPELDLYCAKLAQQQALMYAESKHALLIVLQALDSGGKDGTVDHVFGAFNAQGATVTGFKQPTALELAHDFLWRVHPHVPAKGWVSIFNRSHYEDVLVTRVHKLIDRATCVRRYERIRDFETELFESGTTILKFLLHISKEEQLARFEKRLDDPARRWKISAADYSERELWGDYMAAFQDALSATSTSHAPWYVIPANHKWFRNLAVSQIVADTMEDLGMKFPPPTVDLADIRQKYHAAVLQEQQQASTSRRQ